VGSEVSSTGTTGLGVNISIEGSPSSGLTGGVTGSNGGSLSLQTSSKGVGLNGDNFSSGSAGGGSSSGITGDFSIEISSECSIGTTSCKGSNGFTLSPTGCMFTISSSIKCSTISDAFC